MKKTRSVPHKRDKPRAVKVARRQGGGSYVLTMLDYSTHVTPHALGLWPIWEDQLPTKPVPISGLCPLPVRFSVSGADLRNEVELVLDRVKLDKSGKRSKLGWVSITVGSKPYDVVNDLPRLPLETLAKRAIELCGVVGVWYPPKYEGAFFLDEGRTLVAENTNILNVGELGEAYFVAWADSRDPIVSDLAKAQRPPKLNSDTQERLELVAKAWKAAEVGHKAQAVQEALYQAEGFEWSLENVKRLIKKCRQFGLIPKSTKGK